MNYYHLFIMICITIIWLIIYIKAMAIVRMYYPEKWQKKERTKRFIVIIIIYFLGIIFLLPFLQKKLYPLHPKKKEITKTINI